MSPRGCRQNTDPMNARIAGSASCMHFAATQSTSRQTAWTTNDSKWSMPWCEQMEMGYNFDFFNFIIMTSSCHMSIQIQIPNSKSYIIFYPPIKCLQNSVLTKLKKIKIYKFLSHTLQNRF